MSYIDTNDRLALFGYGVFETLRVEELSIEVPRLHYERMSKGAEVLGLGLPDYNLWYSELMKTVKNEYRISPYALRITLSGGAGEEIPPQLFQQIRPIQYTEKDYREGIKVTLLDHPRNEHSPCVKIKSTNYIENLLAKKEAAKQGAREGIWLNTQGYLVEGTMSNLFFVKDSILYTPSLECGCLPGTRRQIIIECARKLNVPVVEGFFSAEFMNDAEEIFLTNALMGILPVSQMENRFVNVGNSHGNTLRHQLAKIYKENLG